MQEVRMRVFRKLNGEELPLEYSTEKDGYHFVFSGVEYSFEDFIRLRNNPWLPDPVGIPEYIHAVESTGMQPLYIELVGDSAVNVYEEVYDSE